MWEGRWICRSAGTWQNVNKVLGLLGNGMFYFDVRQGVTGTITGVAANAQDAQQAHDGLVGFLGLGRMMIPKNQPDLARASGRNPGGAGRPAGEREDRGI